MSLLELQDSPIIPIARLYCRRSTILVFAFRKQKIRPQVRCVVPNVKLEQLRKSFSFSLSEGLCFAYLKTLSHTRFLFFALWSSWVVSRSMVTGYRASRAILAWPSSNHKILLSLTMFIILFAQLVTAAPALSSWPSLWPSCVFLFYRASFIAALFVAQRGQYAPGLHRRRGVALWR